MLIARVSGIDFYSIVVQAKMMLKSPLDFNLHIYLPSEYEEMECEADRTGLRQAGFAVWKGELVNLFSLRQGNGDELVRRAIQRRARTLNCYDVPALVNLYGRNGFRIIGREPWDPLQADPRWNTDKWGTPDVVHMELETE